MPDSSVTETSSPFVCARCGACCRWPGYVRLTADEPGSLAAFLGLAVEEFVDQYTRLTADRHGLSLIETASGACCFLAADQSCRIHPVKPRQCRTFPAQWDVPPELKARCRGRQGG
jgi:hypothetical protein